jgi:sulfite exporter TauE/SafE
MLASIHPLGERARNSRFAVTAAAYAVGSVAGGALIGVIAGAVGSWWAPPAIVAVGACVAAAWAEASGVRLPGTRRQVNEEWMTRYRGWVYGAGFGFQLGLGVVTIVTTAAVYATVALAVVAGSVTGGAVIGAAFGLARALPLIGVAGVEQADQLRAFHRRTQSWAASGRVGAAAGLAALAAVVVAR